MSDNPNFEESAKSFRKAVKGLGTDESRIISEICFHSKAQRQEIKKIYQKLYGKSLEEKLKSELNGNFQKAVLALMMTTEEFEARFLRDSIKLSQNIIFSDDDAIIQLICTKNNEQMKSLSSTYKKLFNFDLEKDLESNISGSLGTLLLTLVKENSRDTSTTASEQLAKRDAKELYDAGAKQTIANEKIFTDILCSRSYAQLALTFEYYYQLASTTIDKAIEKEIEGKLKHAFLALINLNQNLPEYFAARLYESMNGIGTNDNDLYRIIIWRSEIDLDEIKKEYKKAFNSSLYNDVKDDTSGHYRKLLLAIIGKH